MAVEKKTPTGDESVGAKDEQAKDAGMTTHEQNHAVRHPADKPSFDDAEGLIRAGLTLIPLHHWNAVDAKGRDRGKTPRDGAWTAREYDSHEVLEQARRDGRNVGVRLPPTWMVLDVDPRNFPEGRDPLAELAADVRLDLSLCPHVVTGSGGHHYYFTKPADVQVLDSLEEYPGVEFKSHGRQVVAPGSVHPSGRRYEWDDLAPFPDEAPQVPESLLSLIRRPTRAHGEAAGLGELTPEMLAETLKQIEPEDFQDHDRWRDLMMACHHATAGEGRQEFIEWSTQDAKYQDDAWIIGRRWDSLHASPSGGRRGRPVTVKFLHKVVQEAGGEVARTAPEDDFDAWEDPAELGQGVDESLLRTAPADDADSLDALKQSWVWVGDASVFIRRHDLKRYKPEQWKSMFAHLWEGGDILTKVWKSRGFVPKFESLTYLPGAAEMPDGKDAGRYNLWRPNGVTPAPGDVSWFLDHVAYIVPDAGEREKVLDYLAHLVQHPAEKVHFALLIQGDEGTGKSAIGEVMLRIIGKANVVVPKNDELLEKWTGWQERAQLAIISELMTLGRMEVANRLKPVITDPTLRIEEKFQVTYTIDNHLNLLCFTNHRDAIKLSAGDRRWFVVFSPAKPQDKEYYTRLFDDHILADGPAHVAHWLLQRDLSGFNPKGRAPVTSAKVEMLSLTAGEVDVHLSELLRDGLAPFDFDLVSVEELEDAVPESIRRETKRLRTAVRKFLLDVAKAEQHPRNTNSSGRAASLPNHYLWSIRNHCHWAKVGATARALAHAEHRGWTEEDFTSTEGQTK